jgi:hypothetical protein
MAGSCIAATSGTGDSTSVTARATASGDEAAVMPIVCPSRPQHES